MFGIHRQEVGRRSDEATQKVEPKGPSLHPDCLKGDGHK